MLATIHFSWSSISTVLLSTVIPFIAAILILGLLVLLHEFGHYIVARLCGMRVDVFSIGFGPALVKRKYGETVYQISAFPLGGYVQIAGMISDVPEVPKKTDGQTEDAGKSAEELRVAAEEEEKKKNDPGLYENHPRWHRFLVVLAGPFMNYLIAVVILLGLGITKGVPRTETIIETVVEKSVAQNAGFKERDQLVSINGKKISSTKEFVKELAKTQNPKPSIVEVGVLRANTPLMIKVLPDDKGKLGIAFDVIYEKHPGVLKILDHGFISPLRVMVEIPKSLDKNSLSGPVGIVSKAKEAIAKDGVLGALSIALMLTISLAFFNLLPFPVLDGGRLVFIMYEMVTRRRVNKKVEMWTQIIGVIFLLGLFLLVTLKDIFS